MGYGFNYSAPEYEPFYANEGDFTGDKKASKMRAALHRNQWEDYKRRFKPIEQALINNVGSMERTQRLTNRAAQGIRNQYEQAVGSFQRNLGQYGLQLDDRERTGTGSDIQRSWALDTARASNDARRFVSDTDKQTLSGAGVGLRKLARGDQ